MTVGTAPSPAEANAEPTHMAEHVAIARGSGVAVESLARHYADGPGEPCLLLGYGAIPLGRIGAACGFSPRACGESERERLLGG